MCLATKLNSDLLSIGTEKDQFSTPSNMAAPSRSSEDEIPAKKIKLTDEKSQDDSISNLQNFRGFQLIKILNENAQTKTIAVHGKRVTLPCNL